MTTYTANEKRYDVPTATKAKDDAADSKSGYEWFRRCGDSGLKLPAISLGCWHNFGGTGTDAARHTNESDFHENCRQMLFTAFDNGITHFDLANNYGPPPGSAETRVGRILKEDFANYRDELLISSKAGYGMWGGPYNNGGSRKYMIASLDASLKRLQLEYVDIFYTHRPDAETPLEETLFALDTVVRQGKALYAGISNYSGAATEKIAEICRSNGWVRPIIHQPNYSMLNRPVEQDVIPATDKTGMGTIAFCPLAQGLLTNKYLTNVPDDSRVKQPSGALGADRVTPQMQQKLNKLNDLAKNRGQSLAQMTLAWTLRRQGKTGITSALIGASRPAQIIENIKYRDNPILTAEELSKIETILGE